MAKNFINAGNVLPVVNAGTVVSGAMVRHGLIRGIADRSGASGDANEVHRNGHFEVPKIAGALAVGDLYKVSFANNSAGVQSTAAISDSVVAFGIVTKAAYSADATVTIVLTPTADI
jgi:predicted RecA/RadA family phage recombinase